MRRSSRLTFEKTFLIVATTWRRLANAFFTAIPQPSFSRPLYFSTLHRFSSFHASLLPRGRTLEHPTLPSFLSSTRSKTIVQAHSTIRFPYGAFPASSLSMASASIREIFWNRDRTVQIPDLPLSLWWRWRIERVWLRMVGCCSILEVSWVLGDKFSGSSFHRVRDDPRLVEKSSEIIIHTFRNIWTQI